MRHTPRSVLADIIGMPPSPLSQHVFGENGRLLKQCSSTYMQRLQQLPKDMPLIDKMEKHMQYSLGDLCATPNITTAFPLLYNSLHAPHSATPAPAPAPAASPIERHTPCHMSQHTACHMPHTHITCHTRMSRDTRSSPIADTATLTVTLRIGWIACTRRRGRRRCACNVTCHLSHTMSHVTRHTHHHICHM